MTTPQSNKVGISALVVYALLTVPVAVLFFELGSKPLGYTSLASLFVEVPGDDHAATRRYGKMQIRSDQRGHCREYSVDNKTQQIVLSGTVICDREQHARFNQRTRTEVLRDAFRGQ